MLKAKNLSQEELQKVVKELEKKYEELCDDEKQVFENPEHRSRREELKKIRGMKRGINFAIYKLIENEKSEYAVMMNMKMIDNQRRF